MGDKAPKKTFTQKIKEKFEEKKPTIVKPEESKKEAEKPKEKEEEPKVQEEDNKQVPEKSEDRVPVKVKRGEYQIHIFLEEGRGFVPAKEGDTIDAVITITAFGTKKYTTPKDDISAGAAIYWGEHFFFNAPKLETNEVETSKILIEIRDHKFLLSDSLIGNYEMDLMYVYSRANHALVHQWIALCNPESEDFQTVRGHLKLGICVQAEDDEDVDLTVAEKEEAKTSEILLPPQIQHKWCQLIVRVIKAEGLPKLDDWNNTIDAYCQADYGGAKINTSVFTADKNKFAAYWYEDLYVPVSIPSVSNRLIIRVLDYDNTSKDDMVGTIAFDWEEIEAGKYSDYFWTCIYGAPKDLDNGPANKMNDYPELASAYRGRILMKMIIEHPKKASLKKERIIDPEINNFVHKTYEVETNYEMRSQIFSGIALPKAYSKYSIIVSWCGKEVESKIVLAVNGKCNWYETLKRKIMKIPFQAERSLPDVFVYLVADNEKICYARVSPYGWNNVNSNGTWIALLPDKAIGKINKDWEGGFIMLRLYITPYDENNDNLSVGRWNVPPRLKKMQKVKLIVNLYQCKNLPAADSDGNSDPYIEIYCCGVTKRSKTKPNTLNPMWYETIPIDFEISSLEDNPPILIYVFDEDEFSADDLIGICIIPLSEASKSHSMPKVPKWIPLSLGKSDSGKILISFNLYTEQDKVPEYSIVPKCIDAVVEINCLGLRDLQPALGWLPVNKAFIKFDMNSLQVPGENLVIRNAQTPPGDSGPNPNISTIIKFTCKMPIEKLYAPSLTCTVYDFLFKGLSQPQLGTFSINLGEIFHKRKRRLKKPSPVDIAPKILRGDSSLDMEIPIDTASDAESAFRPSTITTKTSRPSIEEAKAGAFVIDPVYSKDKKGKVTEVSRPDSKYMQLGYDKVPGDKTMHYRYILESDLEKSEYIDASPFEKFDIKRGQDKGIEDNWLSILHSNKNIDDRNLPRKPVGQFKGLIRVMKKDKNELREARMDLQNSRKKYLKEQVEKTGKIEMGDAFGIFGGAFPTKEDEEKEEENEGEEDIIDTEFENIQRSLLTKTDILVRVYVIDAFNLAQKDLKSNSDPYLRIKLGKHVIDDSDHYQKDEPNPKFFSCFDLKTVLPGPSKLKIQVWDKDLIIKDDKIGTTEIDLEDRYFSSKWQSLKEKPIETRNLYHPSTKIIQGTIRLWVELYSSTEAPPKRELLPRPPAEFEVRLIIWETRGVKSYDTEGTSDLFVRAWINNCDPKETDTHYRCQNGKGQFNWRLKFPLFLPNDHCIANLQIWDRDVISFSDFIGDVSFSFTELAKSAFETEGRVKKMGVDDKGFHIFSRKESDQVWIPCKRRTESGEYENAGDIKVTFEIVPKYNADSCPVGEGRGKPNIDPYLPPPTGRFQWSLNPFSLISQTCGPEFRCKICCAVCCLIICLLIILIGPSVIGSVIGKSING
ncbi:unnamed protein product [Blepharisma stoltei]|uniref:C2 domain-containing protein n=1 Tax=Blepharisma stoltei TaxID=1481888 RepID=A0AAU9ITZ9_9CILI|nr:unnamed protein product [Blepharisma stoltei]